MHSRTKTEPCLSLPMPWDIKVAGGGGSWQFLGHTAAHFYILSAFYDDRGSAPHIRILAMSDTW